MNLNVALRQVVENCTSETMSAFLRQANGSFRPARQDYDHFIDAKTPVESLEKLGEIEFATGERLIAAAGRLKGALTARSGKLRQYEIAKNILKDEHWDAGLFVFYDGDGRFRFSLVTAQYYGTQRRFSNYRRFTYFVAPGEPNRTFLEQVGGADFSILEGLRAAFSVEPVTNAFFKEYEALFRQAEASITEDWLPEHKRLYTQRFFNRLVFIAFLGRKGWLKFNGRSDYLRALFEDYYREDRESQANFHRSRLNTLFFWGLNNTRGQDERERPEFMPLRALIGEVPYLNGGLFEKEVDDETWFFPDDVVARILNDLIYRFNFTVAESTPLDVEVAVDPEMLGKMFEELVTGRHESGSYYTPKPVVSFMGREALRYYLAETLPDESPEALERFVYENDAAGLRHPEAALTALREVKICDPACGSGAYLLGMLHELLDLRAALFTARQRDADTVYERKLEIIQNNLYGVDLDPFAVNIARLRLWLSLIVDYEGDDPPPLPNLDFKIEVGDSLTAPDPSASLELGFRAELIRQFVEAKNAFMSAHAGSEEKRRKMEEIHSLRAQIQSWLRPEENEGFDWAVEFAEVFFPQLSQATLRGGMANVLNTAGGQMELTPAPQPGGFDIVLANPPYVRQELLGAYKDQLKPIYPEVHNGTADLYVYFYARAQQLLRPGGVSCFISSNKWLRAGYGEKLRRHLLDKQAFHLVVDFGDLPVFQSAIAYPCIFLWQKKPRFPVGRVVRDKSRPTPASSIPTTYTVVKDLQAAYAEGLRAYLLRMGESLPAAQFGAGKPRLVSRRAAELRRRMEASGPPLGEYVDGKIYRGIVTGYNKAFIIETATRERLIAADPRSAEIIKPLLKGDDVRHYEIHYRERYLIWTYIGVRIEEYPAVFEYLCAYREPLERRQDQGKYWWELRACTYYDVFEQPKITYPEIGEHPRFCFDTHGKFPLKTLFSIATEDYYLLAVLNSNIANKWYHKRLSLLRGGYRLFSKDLLRHLPIPEAPQTERQAVAALAQRAQALHTQRRARVEAFLRALGRPPAESNSRNPLEKPWLLAEDEFTRRARRYGTPDTSLFSPVCDETAAMTEEIEGVEAEIDARVAALYGVGD